MKGSHRVRSRARIWRCDAVGPALPRVTSQAPGPIRPRRGHRLFPARAATAAMLASIRLEFRWTAMTTAPLPGPFRVAVAGLLPRRTRRVSWGLGRRTVAVCGRRRRRRRDDAAPARARPRGCAPMRKLAFQEIVDVLDRKTCGQRDQSPLPPLCWRGSYRSRHRGPCQRRLRPRPPASFGAAAQVAREDMGVPEREGGGHCRNRNDDRAPGGAAGFVDRHIGRGTPAARGSIRPGLARLPPPKRVTSGTDARRSRRMVLSGPVEIADPRALSRRGECSLTEERTMSQPLDDEIVR